MKDEERSQTVLIVDDTPDNIRILMETLKGDYKILAATSGEKALNASNWPVLPDLIILDIMMPGMNGYEVCRKLKEDERIKDIPVLFMSALNETTDKVKAFSAGGVDYITKPFQAEEVRARVQTHMAMRRLQKELQELNRELAEANQQLERLANLDGLTQIANRRHFNNTLEKEWLRMVREKLPISLILIDIDYFKRYNDTYGHLAGDECLKKVAQCIYCTAKRPADLVARYGGEEFVVLMPNTHIKGALTVAEEIRNGIRELKIEHSASDVSLFLSLSMGICGKTPGRASSPEALLAEADTALYKAKNSGRNRIVAQGIEDDQGRK
jgi:diguanylate cyclase (GGDEF)-like protein